MKTVNIVFTKSKKKFPIGSLLIRLWTGKEYSHVARGLKVHDWGTSYYQSSEGNVNYEHESSFNLKHDIVESYEIPVSDEVYKAISKACWENAGKPYGYLQNLGIVYVDFMSMLGIRATNPWKKGENCSELIYRYVIIPTFGDLGHNPDTIKPHHIEDIIKKYYINN